MTPEEASEKPEEAPQEILSGNPIIYDRFRTDGWIFEWLISDYYEDFWEDDLKTLALYNTEVL